MAMGEREAEIEPLILLAGGTGTLGSRVISLLAGNGKRVRVLSRDPERAAHVSGTAVEVVQGDVLDRSSLERAMSGVRVVISAVHGFNGSGAYNPRTVDAGGNRNLIHAARAAGVEHFILISIQGASQDHPIELFRMKHQAEEDLRSSGLDWTILRPTAYMETWMSVVGEPLLRDSKTRIFGRGRNPINFVSVEDVARFVALAVTDPAMRGVCLDIGGPENITMRQFVQTFQTVTGASGRMGRIPRPMMRLVSVVLRSVDPVLARHAATGVVMDTRDMRFNPAETVRRFPSIAPTSLADAARSRYAAEPPPTSADKEREIGKTAATRQGV